VSPAVVILGCVCAALVRLRHASPARLRGDFRLELASRSSALLCAQQYLANLKSYVASLEAEVRAIDPWSVQELDRALEHLRNNQRWVLGSGEVIVLLQGAREIIDEHKVFLRQHGILPNYLAA
jgi:hypothetical protein